jgi:ribosomal protein S27AE
MRPKLDPDAIVNLPCPKCGEKVPQTIAELEHSPRIRCGKCGNLFGVSYAKIVKKLEEAQARAEAQRRGF